MYRKCKKKKTLTKCKDLYIILSKQFVHYKRKIRVGKVSIEIDTLLALFQKFCFGDHFYFFSKTQSTIFAEVTNQSN